jgi:hypothetical protein
MRPPVLVLVAVVTALAGHLPCHADVPYLVNYQGHLTDELGVPLTGNHTLTFRIYTDSTVSGTLLWQEIHEGVAVDVGLFHVILGSTTAIVDSLFGADERWVGIAVDSDSEITPRARITSVPWAFRAAIADTVLSLPAGIGDGHSLDAADGDPTDVVDVSDNGKVGIGTVPPARWNLSVGGEDSSFVWGGDHSGSGWVRIGTLQICWGSLSVNSATAWNVDIDFPRPFLDYNYSLSAIGGGEWSFVTAWASNKGLSSWHDLTMLTYNGDYATGTVHWMAIGSWRGNVQ